MRVTKRWMGTRPGFYSIICDSFLWIALMKFLWLPTLQSSFSIRHNPHTAKALYILKPSIWSVALNWVASVFAGVDKKSTDYSSGLSEGCDKRSPLDVSPCSHYFCSTFQTASILSPFCVRQPLQAPTSTHSLARC